MDKLDLQGVSTTDLINELESRPGVKKISVGQYKTYELKKKYSNDRKPIECDSVLVIDHLES